MTCESAPVASGEVDLTGASGEADLTSRTTERAVTFEEPEIFQQEEVEIERETVEPEDDLQEGCVPDRTETQAAELVDVRNSINKGYNLRASTRGKHVYSTFSIKAARKIYGKELSDKATDEELRMCIQKDVWEYLEPTYVTKGAIPSQMFLTPKKLPNGDIDRIKGRVVTGGHRQDRSLYDDNEISSPTVALTSVIVMAALAARERHHVMTLDHKAAYLNA